jgi:DNA-binding NarL/FixJ family response regulator
VPLALILLGQAASGAIVLVDAQVTMSLKEGRRSAIANIARPHDTSFAKLTDAERSIALGIVEGSSKREIARSRRTSLHTVGRQVSAVFAKLDVKGRFDLIRRMSE